jgi:hypothetical protein
MECPPPLAPKVPGVPGENNDSGSFQTLAGEMVLPESLRWSWVPPKPVTSGSEAGHSVFAKE